MVQTRRSPDSLEIGNPVFAITDTSKSVTLKGIVSVGFESVGDCGDKFEGVSVWFMFDNGEDESLVDIF